MARYRYIFTVLILLSLLAISGCDGHGRNTTLGPHSGLLGGEAVTNQVCAYSVGAAGAYGVCAHLIRHDHDFRDKECAAIAALGSSTVRFGVSWRGMQKSPDAPLDFSKLDAIVAEAEAHGLTILPILYWPPKWAQPVYEHLDEYAAFIEAVVEHYGERFPAIELWNEENLKGFWGEDPDPAKYALVLKAGYEAAKRAARSTPPGPSGATPLSEGGNAGDPFPQLRSRSNYLSREAALRPRSGHLSGEAALNGGGGAAPAVYFGGTAGVPLDYIRKVYEAGGGPFFDALAIHPYGYPYAPEGDLDKKLDDLRALMAEFGDADKPIVITEHGWPTHKATVPCSNVLLAGLKVARPEQKTWRVAYATTKGNAECRMQNAECAIATNQLSGEAALRPQSSHLGGGAAFNGESSGIAAALAAILPPGSSCEECNGARLRERLAAGDVDAVVYPFDATFPVDTFDDVCEFVKKGGVLVDIGGAAMWRPMRETPSGLYERLGEDNGKNPLRARLRVAVDAWWLNDALPKEGRAFPTDAAKAAGYKGDPAGERVWRFFTPKLLEEGDEMVPLLELPLESKKDAGDDAPAPRDCAVAACVLKFNSDFKGAIVLCGDKPGGKAGATDEQAQSRYLTRAMAIAFAKGVERYFWYEFRAPEDDPCYSEDHFGMTHADMSPKPAFDAYRAFVLMRPAGSVQSSGPWHDEKRALFFPQWTRPDGTKAGVIWKLGATEKRELRFVPGSAGILPATDAQERLPPEIRFRDHLGRALQPTHNSDGSCIVPIGEAPVFFEGGELLHLQL